MCVFKLVIMGPPGGPWATSTTCKLPCVRMQDILDLDALKNMKGSDGIDPERKEEYLSDEQFEEAFGTSKAAFAATPKWKRQQKKKAVGLF